MEKLGFAHNICSFCFLWIVITSLLNRDNVQNTLSSGIDCGLCDGFLICTSPLRFFLLLLLRFFICHYSHEDRFLDRHRDSNEN